MKLDLAPPEVREDIIRRKFVKGHGYGRICKWLKSEYKISISAMALRKWVTRRANTASHLVYGSSMFRETVAKEYSEVFKVIPKVMKILYNRVKEISNVGGPTNEIAMMSQEIREIARVMENSLDKSSSVKGIEENIDEVLDKDIKVKSIKPTEHSPAK